MQSNWKLGLAFSLATVLMWGFLPLALKVVLAVMDPLTISWYRFSLSTIIALLWYGYKRGPALKRLVCGRHWPLTLLVVTGLLSNYLLYIVGLDHINPGASQILIQVAPLLLLLGSVILFGERFSQFQWGGVFCLCLGLLLFFHQRLGNTIPSDDSYLTGVILIFAAAVTWAIYGLAQKKLLEEHNAQDILLLICLAGTILFLPLAEPQQIRSLSNMEVAVLAFCGVNTIIAYGSFGLAMSYWEASKVSAIIPLTPLLTLFFTAVLNHWGLADIASEPIDGLSALGALLVVAGAVAAALPSSTGKS